MNLDRAIQVAVKAHSGIMDKTNLPSILHPLRVMGMLSLSPEYKTTNEQIVAVLHDTIEDTIITLYDLQTYGYAEEIILAVDAITRRDNEIYMDYIKRLSKNKTARIVKMMDLIDNMNRDDGFDIKTKMGLRKRYEKALAYLYIVHSAASNMRDFNLIYNAVMKIVTESGLTLDEWLYAKARRKEVK